MESFFAAENLLTLLTLTGLEIVLGIDNVIFIALLVEHLKGRERVKARFIGLSLALILRIILLFGASWIIGLTQPLFTIFTMPFSGRSLLLIIGGLFLVVKSILETRQLFNEETKDTSETISSAKENKHAQKKFRSIITQIIFVDLILSFDSIITAVGMTNNLPVIIIAIFIAIGTMMISAKPIGNFIYQNPSIKVIALAFIFLVGVLLVGNGFNIDIPKPYLYFAMFFCMGVEIINILLRKKQEKKANLSSSKTQSR